MSVHAPTEFTGYRIQDRHKQAPTGPHALTCSNTTDGSSELHPACRHICGTVSEATGNWRRTWAHRIRTCGCNLGHYQRARPFLSLGFSVPFLTPRRVVIRRQSERPDRRPYLQARASTVTPCVRTCILRWRSAAGPCMRTCTPRLGFCSRANDCSWKIIYLHASDSSSCFFRCEFSWVSSSYASWTWMKCASARFLSSSLAPTCLSG